MGHRKGEKYLFNVRLAKVSGLHLILNPKSFKLCGYNVYHIIFVILVSYVCLISVVMCINGLFYWKNHRSEAVLYFGAAETFLHTSYKILIVIYRSKEIRLCLAISRFNPTSYDHNQYAGLLKLWRNRIVQFTNLYAVSSYFALLIYVLCPIMSTHGVNEMKSLDGSQGHFRTSVLNLYALFSDETYNAHFKTMYLVESLGTSLFIIFFVIFDVLFITLVLAFSCQLKMICIAFKSSGPKRVIEDPIQNFTDVENLSNICYSPIEHCVVYNDLKNIIIFHQAVIKNLEIFFSIFQNVTLSQIIVSSTAIISILLNLTMTLIDGKLDANSRITVIKMMFACPVAIFQLFVLCFLFDFLHNQKKSINFAMYSSNWTEMDMKCKKLILLAMCMDNAHKQTMKFSQLKIVNLEFFFITMRVCYSILSVMLKTRL